MPRDSEGLTGCVIHTNDDPFSGDDDIEDSILRVSPAQVEPGTHALTVQDFAYELDFDEVNEVRPISDFEILEWSSFEEELSLVVAVPEDVRGTQTIAIDTWEGTAYATFEVY